MKFCRAFVRMVPWRLAFVAAVVGLTLGRLDLVAAPIHIGQDLLNVAEGASLDSQDIMFYAAVVILIASGIWAWISDHGVMKTLMIALACIVIGGGAVRVATLLVR